MDKISIIIGSGFGDEGKGHTTDFLCNKRNTLNIRFNGGAQASHTVVTPNGKRHAFRHFGSGTFVGAETYLSKHFIVNPFSFLVEHKELNNEFLVKPIEYVNPSCIVSTLWDMYINQAVEELRGKNRHGSCGFGINETVERSKYDKYKITVKDMLSREKLYHKLKLIECEYVPFRLKQEYGISINDIPKEYQELLLDTENINVTLYYFDYFIANTIIVDDSIIRKFDNIVFEGAQGLLLDQNNEPYFPHVTTSNTGIKNAIEILQGLNYKGKVDIYYISRCYATRHGEGTFITETKEIPYENIEDLTNIPNRFQGSLRFGILDFDTMLKYINKDIEDVNIDMNVNVVLTCFDQLDNKVKFYLGQKEHTISKQDFLNMTYQILTKGIKGLNKLYVSNGLTRENFFKYKK